MNSKEGSRFRGRFTIRVAFILTTIACIAVAIWSAVSRPAQLESEAMKMVRERSGSYETVWRGPAFLDHEGRRLSVFDRIETIKFTESKKITDEDLKLLLPLTELRILWLTDVPLSDEAVTQLKQLKRLEKLILLNTEIAPAALSQLEKELPQVDLVLGGIQSKEPMQLVDDQFVIPGSLRLSNRPGESRMLEIVQGAAEISGPVDIGQHNAPNTVEKAAYLNLKNRSKTNVDGVLTVEKMGAVDISIGSKLNVNRWAVIRGGRVETTGKDSELIVEKNLRVWENSVFANRLGSTVNIKDWAKLDGGTWRAGKESKITIANHFAIHDGGKLTLSDGSSMTVGNWATLSDGTLELVGGNFRVGKWMRFDPQSRIEVTLQKNLVETSALAVDGSAKLGGFLQIVLDEDSPDDTSNEFPILKANRISGKFAEVEFPDDGSQWRISYQKTRVVVLRNEGRNKQ